MPGRLEDLATLSKVPEKQDVLQTSLIQECFNLKR
jgi:hypothetical protein